MVSPVLGRGAEDDAPHEVSFGFNLAIGLAVVAPLQVSRLDDMVSDTSIVLCTLAYHYLLSPKNMIHHLTKS